MIRRGTPSLTRYRTPSRQYAPFSRLLLSEKYATEDLAAAA
jgi:hypothetical protein